MPWPPCCCQSAPMPTTAAASRKFFSGLPYCSSLAEQAVAAADLMLKIPICSDLDARPFLPLESSKCWPLILLFYGWCRRRYLQSSHLRQTDSQELVAKFLLHFFAPPKRLTLFRGPCFHGGCSNT